MEHINDNTSENKEFVSDISNVSLGFTKNEEEIVKSIAKTLVEDIPFLNIDNGKMRASEDFPLDSKAAQVLLSNAESKDTLQSTVTDLNVLSSKPRLNTYLQEKISNSVNSISLAEGTLTPSVGDVVVKTENSEVPENMEGNFLECKYELVESDDKESVVGDRKGIRFIHDKRGNERKLKKMIAAEKESLKYICKLCGIFSRTPSSLRNHMMTHTGQKPHRCPYCSMTFRQTHHLTEHKRTHTGERPFECELCEDAFTTKSALKSHMKIHDELKDHKCQICHAAFSDRLQLRVHIRKHGKKLYECSDCGDKFITAPRLKRHQMIHTGERPYQCEECGVAFREETTLRAHMGTHLPRGPYPCYLCGKIFSRLNSLSLHKKVHNTDGTYRYVPKKMEAMQEFDNSVGKSVNNNTGTKIFLSEDRKEENDMRSKSASSSSDTFAYNQNLQTQAMDSTFSSITEPSNDLTRNIVADVEQEMVNVPHPDVVRDALATGTVLESQGENGQEYLIVLPKALAEKDYTLITLPPVPTPKIPMVSESVVLQESEELGHSNCDLLVWDNDLDAVTEVAFEPERELLAVEDIDSKAEKQKKQKDSAGEEVLMQEGLHLSKSVKIQRKEKKIRDKKIRIPKSYECQHCGRNCKTSSNYIIHMRTHTGERPYYCDYCGLGFKQLAHLKAHVRIHTGEEPYKCNICDATFKQSSRLRSHQRSQHLEGKIRKKKIVKKCSIRNFYCKICDKTFLDSCYKKQHMKTHADEAQYNCDRCNAVFKTKSTLKKHGLLHVNDSWGICELCGFQFKSVKTLNMHKQASHGREIDDIKKEGSIALEPIKLEAESDISSSEEVKENIVKSGFNSHSKHLKHHKGSHSVSECTGNMIKTKRDTISISADFKQYQCSVCKKIFKQSSNLKTHMRMHTDERPYKCNDCGSAFRQISHLKDHVKMHTGEKPFRCSGCSAAFTQSSAVKYHIKKYHRGKAHVVKEQKNIHLQDRESIILEKTAQVIDDTIVINIDNGVSVSVEHKRFERGTGPLRNQKQGLNIEHGKDIFSYTQEAHGFTSSERFVQKCEMCNRFIEKPGHNIKAANSVRKQNVCKRCLAHRKSSKLLVPVIRCKEELKKEDNEIHIDRAEEQEPVSKESFLKNDMKKKREKRFEPITKLSEVNKNNEYEEPCCKVEDKNKNSKQYEKNIGNSCEFCGKTFGRASALKFHKHMSHKKDYDEEEEEEEKVWLNCKSEDNDIENKMKKQFLNKNIKETVAGQSNQYPSDAIEIKEEAGDFMSCEIEYCKCSFCGEKLSDMSELNEHVSKSHPKEMFLEKSIADLSPVSCNLVTKRYVMQNKRKKWTSKNKKENEKKTTSSVVSNTVTGENICFDENSRYKCQGCGKCFTRVAKLKDHVNSWCKVPQGIKYI